MQAVQEVIVPEIINNYSHDIPKKEKPIFEDEELAQLLKEHRPPHEFYEHESEWEDKELLKYGIINGAYGAFYEFGHLFKDKELLKLGVKHKAAAHFYEAANEWEDKELLKLAVINNAAAEVYYLEKKWDKEKLRFAILHKAAWSYYKKESEWEDKKLLKWALEHNLPWGFYFYNAKGFKHKKLLELAVEHNADEYFYIFANKFENKDLLRWGILNNASSEFYEKGYDWEYNDLLMRLETIRRLKNNEERLFLGDLYFYGTKCKHHDTLNYLINNKVPYEFFMFMKDVDFDLENTKRVINIINYLKKQRVSPYDLEEILLTYQEKILTYLKNKKDLKRIKILDKEYADRIKENLSKNNAGKLINLTQILRMQGVSPEEISIPNTYKIKYLEEFAKKRFKGKIRIKNFTEPLTYYYLVQDKKLKKVFKKILTSKYRPKEKYFFEKKYILCPEEDSLSQEINDLATMINLCLSNIQKIDPEYSININKNSIEELKDVGKDLSKKLGSILSEKKSNKLSSEEYNEAVSDAKSIISRVINYNPKTKTGEITIRLDSTDKVGQAKLLEAISSCFHIINGECKDYSQKYLRTNRINFVGIYDKHNSPLARYTIVINPKQKRMGLVSRVYKKTNNDYLPFVKNWLNNFAEENNYEKDKKIKLPLKNFYDDAGKTITGRIKPMKLEDILEY